MPIEHIGLGVPDVDAAKRYYDEFMPLVGYQPCFGTGYCPKDWQGAQVFLYPAIEDGLYSRHGVGLQHIAFLVPTRADVHRVHDWAHARGDEVIHPPRAFPSTASTAMRRSSWTRTGSCWRPSVTASTTSGRPTWWQARGRMNGETSTLDALGWTERLAALAANAVAAGRASGPGDACRPRAGDGGHRGRSRPCGSGFRPRGHGRLGARHRGRHPRTRRLRGHDDLAANVRVRARRSDGRLGAWRAGHRREHRHGVRRAVPHERAEPPPARTGAGARVRQRRDPGRGADEARPRAGQRGRRGRGARRRAGRGRHRHQRDRQRRHRRPASVHRGRPDGRAHRGVRGREVDVGQPAGRHRRAGHRRRPRGRSTRAPHDDRAGTDRAAERWRAHRHAGFARGVPLGFGRGLQQGVRRHRGAGRAVPVPRLRARERARLRGARRSGERRPR